MMNNDKTIVEKALAQTDAAIVSANELAVICDTLIAEKEKLAAHNAMLRKALADMLSVIQRSDVFGVGWERCEQSATIALNATQADVDAWKAALIPAQRSTVHSGRCEQSQQCPSWRTLE